MMSRSLVIVLVSVFIGCGADVVGPQGGPSQVLQFRSGGGGTYTYTPAPAAVLSAGFPVPNQSQTVSGCGGFSGELRGNPDFEPPDDYCEAEVLYWEYDEGILRLLDSRIFISCATGLSIEIRAGRATNVIVPEYTVIETIVDSFADCMCPYDLELDAEGIPDGIIHLELVRDVTVPVIQEHYVYTVFEGSLDLSQGSGSVILGDYPAFMNCE